MSNGRPQPFHYAILDMQFGSTGKGALAGYLARRHKPDTIITAFAPNAGHTYIDEQNRTWMHTQLGNGVVSPRFKQALIGPGSLIDPDKLLEELRNAENLLGREVQLYIHPHAAIVLERHREAEANFHRIGSTKKGTGAAMAERIERRTDSPNVAIRALEGHALNDYVVASPAAWFDLIDESEIVQIEGAQGFSLSMYHGFYPYTTSRDVSLHQVLADCGWPARYKIDEVFGTCRTFPIRVANRFDKDGNQIGTSGPCYSDQCELNWEKDLGRKAELTTVTKLPRRIFSFSDTQVKLAAHALGVTGIFLSFMDYLPKEERLDFIRRVENVTGCPVEFYSDGPKHSDMHDVGQEAIAKASAAAAGEAA